MSLREPNTTISRPELVVSLLILVATVILLIAILPRPILYLGGVIIGTTTFAFGLGYVFYHLREFFPRRLTTIPIYVLLLIPIVVGIGFVWYFEVVFSLVNGLLFFAMLLFVTIYWAVVPLSLYQHYGEQHRTVEVDAWPDVTAIVPAYNEEGYVGPCIDSLLQNNYPDESLEIVVIDDGSTDNTLAEARERESNRVRVLHKENGGKHSAMNHGLEEIDSDLVISSDADSLIDADAIRQLVKTYIWHNEPCAIAGNIKIHHRNSRLERIQALEYIVSINMFRRALDQLGLVKVVPGCLGLFERKTVEDIGGFSGETVTEDFDLTIEILKHGHNIHYSGKAIARTEGPKTVGGLYNQRLRWFRGTIQTLMKHGDIISTPNFGLLHILLMPYMWMSVGIGPVLGFVVLGSIMWMSVFGAFIEVLGLIVIFIILELLFATTALRMENTVEKEEMYLLAYSPLMVIGYKQLQDSIMLKSILDLLLRRRVSWTSAGRNKQSGTNSK